MEFSKRKEKNVENQVKDAENYLEAIRPLLHFEDAQQAQIEAEISKLELIDPPEMHSLELLNGEHVLDYFHRTGGVLKEATSTDGYTLYKVDNVRNEISIYPKDIRDLRKARYSWEIKSGDTVAAHVAHTKKSVITNRRQVRSKFPNFQGFGAFSANSLLSVPVVDGNSKSLAVLELFKKTEEPFSEDQQKIAKFVADYIGQIMQQNERRTMLQKQFEINQNLSGIIHKYFATNQQEKDLIINQLMKSIRKATNSQCASFCGIVENRLECLCTDRENEKTVAPELENLRQKKLTKFAEQCYNSSAVLNIPDVYADPRYDRALDRTIGSLVRSVLCVPIFENGVVVGIVQLVNKLSKEAFSSKEEELIETFAEHLKNFLHSTSLKNKLYIEAKKYEMLEDTVFYQICRIDQPKLVRALEDDHISEKVYDLQYCADLEHCDDLVEVTFKILKLMCNNVFRNDSTLLRFIYNIKRTYRDLPYHNFEHAFMTMHCVFYILQANRNNFDEIEVASMLIAALCHDADHKGVTESFLYSTSDPLTSLYESCPLENHHIWIGRLVIQASELLADLENSQIEKFFKIFDESILATNLKNHVRIRTEAVAIASSGTMDWNNEHHRTLVRSIIMTSSDLSAQAMPTKSARRYSSKLFEEFFNEGDELRSKNIPSAPILDRNNDTGIAKFQADFLSAICIPCFSILNEFLDNVGEMVKACKHTYKTWRDLQN